MNWTASLLRNQLKKEREAHIAQISSLITTSESVRKLKEFQKEKQQLVQELSQAQTNLTNTQQNITNLEAEINSKEHSLKELKSKLSSFQEARKEERFNLQKELRAYHLYHAREIKRLAPDLKAKVANLKEQKGQLLKQIKALQILANHRLDLLEQEKSALITLAKSKIKNKKEASELLAQLQTKWAEEKTNLITEHQTKVEQLESESSEQEQLAAQEIRKLKAKQKAKETNFLREKNQLKAILQRLLTEQEAQLESLE